MKDNCVIGTINAEDSKDVAFLKSLGRETCSHASHGVAKFMIGDRSTGRAINQRRLISEFIDRFENEIGERDFRDRDVRVWTAKDHFKNFECAGLTALCFSPGIDAKAASSRRTPKSGHYTRSG